MKHRRYMVRMRGRNNRIWKEEKKFIMDFNFKFKS